MNTYLFDLFRQWLFRNVTVDIPDDYINKVQYVKDLLSNDYTGLVSSIVDFMVKCGSSVKYRFEVDNDNLRKVLENWKSNINLSLSKKGIDVGIRALAKQYFIERWTSSLVILNIKYKKVDDYYLPDKMWFLDGQGIKIKGDSKKLANYTYSIMGTSEEDDIPLPFGNTDIIIQKPFSAWYQKYPNPYLVARGTLYNALMKKMLKEKQADVLDAIIPYIAHLTAGTEKLFEQGVSYDDPSMTKMKDSFKNNVTNEDTHTGKKGKIWATPFDKNLEHIIPELQKIMTEELFKEVDRDILSSLGMVEIIGKGTRREGIVNPKLLIEEIRAGVGDFVNLIETVIKLTQEKNKTNHKKYGTLKIEVVSSPIKSLLTSDDREMIRSWYDRGIVGKRDALETTTDMDAEVTIERRIQEITKGFEEFLYPPVIMNVEGKGDIDILNPEDFGEITPQKKKSEPDLGTGSLKKAPYENVSELNKKIKDKLSPVLQKIFIKVFNKAWDSYSDYDKKAREILCFKMSWSVIKKLAIKGKDGVWVKKKKLNKAELLKEIIEIFKGDLDE